ncbi:MAG: hypothetical protein DYG86_02440 [Chloroflexi bacterium CFX2]|nr:hypothetical protein [Chloroflexi bacterium CFX2]
MGDFFFSLGRYTLASVVLGIAISTWAQLRGRKDISRAQVIETISMNTFGITGFASIFSFFMHFFIADRVAQTIGWEAGSPFQLEVAGANLAIGLLGFGCFWRKDFWLPYVISKTAFLWVAGITHIIDLVNHENFAPGNAGLTLYMDFIWPLIYIGLLFSISSHRMKIS